MPDKSAENMFSNSILVVAHPDGEILWFSSIIDKVDQILMGQVSEFKTS